MIGSPDINDLIFKAFKVALAVLKNVEFLKRTMLLIESKIPLDTYSLANVDLFLPTLLTVG